MALPELTGPLGKKRAAHLLRRTVFGATISQIDQFAVLTPVQATNALYRQILPEPALPINPVNSLEWISTGPIGEQMDGELQEYFKGWFIGQLLGSEVPANKVLPYIARERIVLFLHTHFTTIQSKVNNSRALYYQNMLFRLFALDALNPDPLINFKTLTTKISVDNAMLILLDGILNVKGSPNENYGRELLELYSIGRGLEGTLPPTTTPGDYFLFTEQDVQAAARVLSGWTTDGDFSTIDEDTLIPRGTVRGSITNASAHDSQPKVFSERFNNAVIQANPTLLENGNQTEASALDEIDQLVNLIYSNEATAKHICWKIYRFFVAAPHTTEQSLLLDSTVIEEMKNVFISSNYKLQAVIENLVRSVHFYEASGVQTDDNFGGIIKSPIDLVLGTFRNFSIPLPPMTTQPTEFYAATVEIMGHFHDMQFNFYEPYDVAGYEAYHQFPIFHRAWITPNSLARRYVFIRNLFTVSEPGMFKVNSYDYVNTNFNSVAADAKLLIMAIASYLLPLADQLSFDDLTDDQATITSRRLNYFLQRFLQSFDEVYWTTRWNEGAADLDEQLSYLFNALLQSPEYQLA